MAKSIGSARMAGLAGSVLLAAGVLAFFVGIFGGPRVLAFAGVALMVVSLIAFYVEEFQNRRSRV